MLYTPARFVDKIVVKLGDELVLRVEGGISLSEDPNIRFHFIPNGTEEINVEATDIDGYRFSGTWPIAGS